MTREVTIVQTGLANVASVEAAFDRLGVRSRLTEDATSIDGAPLLVLPGVGAFRAGMSRLAALGMVEPLRQRVRENRPLLAICLGMQLLCEESEEAPGVSGLGIVPAKVARFSNAVRVPQMGWNSIVPTDGAELLEPGHVYFANSYRLDALPRGWDGAVAAHGGSFVAALQRGTLLACQFHPELSGSVGRRLIGAWMARCSEGLPC
jgi:imidazole glycerol phosphate synthase glutamine amidotransferase subunit